jgi:hypothetical protein
MEEFSAEQLRAVRRWLTSIAVVKFDIDEGTEFHNGLGQMVEYLLPQNSLSKA